MNSASKHMLIRLAVLLPIAALAFEAREYVRHVHPRAQSNVQRVTVLNQPKPEVAKRPAPEPEAKPAAVEPKPSDSKTPFMKFDDYGPGDDSPPGPRDDALGVDAEGGAGSDSFGLVGKKGGQDITTLGPATVASAGSGTGGPHGLGHGGPMAKFAGYAIMLKDVMTAELNRRENLRVVPYEAFVMVWVDPDGRITRVTLAKSTGIPEMDHDIRTALATLPKLSLPPPSDMPQPIDLKIVSKGSMPVPP